MWTAATAPAQLSAPVFAGLDPDMRLEAQDDPWAPTYDHDIHNELTTLRFVKDHQAVFILGPVGVDKTHLAHAPATIACRRRVRVHAECADGCSIPTRVSRAGGCRRGDPSPDRSPPGDGYLRLACHANTTSDLQQCEISPMVPELSSCSNLLLNVVNVAQDSSTSSEAASDSVYAHEIGQDQDVGDQDFMFPYQFTHMIVAALIYASAEALATLRWCVVAEPLPHIMSANELAHAASQASAQASWLGQSDITGKPRLSRLLAALGAADEEEAALSRALDYIAPETGTDTVLKWANRNGIDQRRSTY